MEGYRKYSPGRCSPAEEKEKKQAYQTALAAINVFAGAFCSFFEQEKKTGECSKSESEIMKQIVAELPAVLQFENCGMEEPETGDALSGQTSEQKISDCHKLSFVLSDAYSIPQEAALAIIMPAWCKFMLRTQVDWLADFARQVWDVPQGDISIWTVAQEGIARFQDFICQCGLAVTLREYGIRNFDSRRMAELIIQDYGENKEDFSLRKKDIQSIYELARG